MKMSLHRLEELGFDQSCQDGYAWHVSCSQCAALVINGVPCHETGCPNQTTECEECGQTIPKRDCLCESCAENLAGVAENSAGVWEGEE